MTGAAVVQMCLRSEHLISPIDFLAEESLCCFFLMAQFVNLASCCSAINALVLRTSWPQFLIYTFIPEVIFIIHIEVYSKEETTQMEA